MANTKLVDALLIERAGYERRGLSERVKQVDSALRELGFEHKYLTETASVTPDAERAIKPKARRRTKG